MDPTTCPHCQFENPAEARFCQNCGRKLEQICPHCGTANDNAAKFCMNCGTSLADTPHRPETHFHSPRSERRVVTILFCDVKGSTALAEQLDPERWTEIMDGAFALLTAAVERYDGTVARLMGDAILALFGAPTAHEDDPIRAIRAGLDILNHMRPYQDQIRLQLQGEGLETKETEFEVRVGINTGLVVVGIVGSETAREYTAMGDPVNVAARMEQTATPGTLQIAADTYRSVAPLIDVETLGAIEIKGKREPVVAYRVLGLKADPGRLRGIGGMEAPLIGRRQELSQLKEALVGLHRGDGQIIFLTGEAGLGKSRLVRELKAVNDSAVGRAHAHWFQVASQSFDIDQPYQLMRSLIHQLAGISQGDTRDIIEKQLERSLESLPPSRRKQIRLGLQILFDPASEVEIQLDGEGLVELLAAGIIAFWAYQTGRTPTVVVFEDLHWTDPASIALISKLLPLVERDPLLFLCAVRPEQDSPAWRLKQETQKSLPQQCTTINLQPFTVLESTSMANSLLTMNQLSEKLEYTILNKAEGNPFFLEELVREIVDSGALIREEAGRRITAGSADEIALPESLESLLVARMDRLETPARLILQLASVIGRSFDYQVLDRVSGNQSGLDRQLHTLQKAGLVDAVSRSPERVYAFRHALTQEAVYNTILLKERRQFHRQVGDVMADLFAGELESKAPLLARHYDLAGDQPQAARYYSLAAKRDVRLYANDEALGHYTQALNAAGEAGEKGMLADLYSGRGTIHERLGHFDDARKDLEKAQALAHSAGDQPAEWRALLELGKLWSARDYDITGDYYHQAIDLARQMDDPATLGRSLNRIGNWYVNAERPVEGIKYHREAQTIFEGMADRKGLAATLDMLGMANLIAGDMITAVTDSRRAIDLFRELDDRQGIVGSNGLLIQGSGSLFVNAEVPGGLPEEFDSEYKETLEMARQIGWRAGEVFTFMAMAERDGFRGNLGLGLHNARKALDLATAIEHHQWTAGSNVTFGVVYLASLAFENAVEHLQQAVVLARELRSKFWLHFSSAFLAEAYLGMGRFEQALSSLEEVMGEDMPMETTGQRLCWLARAEVALAQSDPTLGLDIVERLIAGSFNMAPGVVVSSLWLVRGQALLDLGQPANAETILQDGLANTKKYLERAWQWRFHAALARLYRQNGRVEEAEQQSGQGLSVVEAVAATITDDGLRQSFRQRAQNRF